MRTITSTIEVYTFNELSDASKDRVIEEFANSNYYDYILEEMVHSLLCLRDKVGGYLDYSLSCVPDRGEFIKFTDYDKYLLVDLIADKDNMPLTGCCYDYLLLEAIEKSDINSYIDSIHAEYESLLSVDVVAECCEANEYEFTVDGAWWGLNKL